MANVSNPGLLTSLREQKTAQSRFNEAARAASSGSMTKANPAASPAAFVNAESQKLGLKVKEQASKNASQGLAYLEMANAGVSSIKDIFEEVQSLATANANEATSVSQRKINAQQMAAKVAQIASVNKTASLNPGQPVTAGSCRVIAPTINSGAAVAGTGFSNYNAESGNPKIVSPAVYATAGAGAVAAGAVNSYLANAVITVFESASVGTGAGIVNINYYEAGVENVAAGTTTAAAPATFTVASTPANQVVGSATLDASVLGVLDTDSADEALAKTNKFLKQSNVSASDRFKARNLVSIANTSVNYNPDERVKSNTVTSAQYDGMYGILSSYRGPAITAATPAPTIAATPTDAGYNYVNFVLDTGLEVLIATVDTTQSLPETLKFKNVNIEANQDVLFDGSPSGGAATKNAVNATLTEQSDVELNLASLGNNITTALSTTVVQFGRAQLEARFQDTDNSGASTDIKLDALTARSLGLDAIDISSESASINAMDVLEGIKTKLLDNMATVAKAQGEVETAKSQIETNIIATNKVLDTIDGVDSLEIAQIMSQEKQKIQQTIAIMTSQSEQQSAISQGAQQIMRG